MLKVNEVRVDIVPVGRFELDAVVSGEVCGFSIVVVVFRPTHSCLSLYIHICDATRLERTPAAGRP